MKAIMTICLVFAAWAALAFAAAPAGARLTAVTTTTDLKAITEAVGGDRVAVTSIACGYEDPHFVQAKPSYMMAARKADLWVRVGMELEIGWEELVLDGCRNGRIRIGTKGHLDASEGVLRLEVPTTRVTREMGDIHPMGNPHVWLDPLNARLMAKTVADRLAVLDPNGADAFKRNLAAFADALDRRMFGDALVQAVGGDALWALSVKGTLPEFLARHGLTAKLGGWLAAMRPHRGAPIVTYHRSWSYFAHRFGLRVPIELEPKPGIPPSPAHLAKVVELASAQGAKVILVEPFYSRKAPDFVAARTGAAVLVCPNSVGGAPEATDYPALMDLIVDRLTRALAGTVPAPAK